MWGLIPLIYRSSLVQLDILRWDCIVIARETQGRGSVNRSKIGNRIISPSPKNKVSPRFLDLARKKRFPVRLLHICVPSRHVLLYPSFIAIREKGKGGGWKEKTGLWYFGKRRYRARVYSDWKDYVYWARRVSTDYEMEKGREDRPRYILRDHATIFFRAKLHRVCTYKLKRITTWLIAVIFQKMKITFL